MAEYRFGIIFNFERHLKMNDPTNLFADVDHKKLLTEIVRFITDDSITVAESRERINEIEWFIGQLYDKGIVKDYLFHQDEPYVKICGILFAICESIVEIFADTRFYSYCTGSSRDEPRVIHISRDNFAIVVRRGMR